MIQNTLIGIFKLPEVLVNYESFFVYLSFWSQLFTNCFLRHVDLPLNCLLREHNIRITSKVAFKSNIFSRGLQNGSFRREQFRSAHCQDTNLVHSQILRLHKERINIFFNFHMEEGILEALNTILCLKKLRHVKSVTFFDCYNMF